MAVCIIYQLEAIDVDDAERDGGWMFGNGMVEMDLERPTICQASQDVLMSL